MWPMMGHCGQCVRASKFSGRAADVTDTSLRGSDTERSSFRSVPHRLAA